MSGLEVYAGGDRVALRDLHVLANAQTLVPDSFKAGGQVDWGAVALAARMARRLELDPVDNLRLFPVIKGQVFPMAEVWMVLARRHGWRVTIPVDTAERVVVDMAHPATGEHPPCFEMTLEEARQLGTAKTNPNYADGGARSMVRARALMAAIRLNAPEVMQEPGVADIYGDVRPAAAEGTGPKPRSPLDLPLARATVDDTTRARLAEAIDGLRDPVRDDLRSVCRDLELPNLRTSPAFTHADAALVERLIIEAGARPIETDEPTPPDVHDDAPEAGAHDDDPNTYRYDPDDAGRPF